MAIVHDIITKYVAVYVIYSENVAFIHNSSVEVFLLWKCCWVVTCLGLHEMSETMF